MGGIYSEAVFYKSSFKMKKNVIPCDIEKEMFMTWGLW